MVEGPHKFTLTHLSLIEGWCDHGLLKDKKNQTYFQIPVNELMYGWYWIKDTICWLNMSTGFVMSTSI